MKYYLFNYSTTALILSCNVFPSICGSGSMVAFFLCALFRGEFSSFSYGHACEELLNPASETSRQCKAFPM